MGAMAETKVAIEDNQMDTVEDNSHTEMVVMEVKEMILMVIEGSQQEVQEEATMMIGLYSWETLALTLKKRTSKTFLAKRE
jgi:DNA-binding protein Fis